VDKVAVMHERRDLSGRHPVPEAIEERSGRYIGRFENAFGEQMVFVYDDGDAEGILYLGDVGWESCRVSEAGGLPDVADLILNREERAFLHACWIATAWRRESGRRASKTAGASSVDAVASRRR
jgi:hypothetical protein